MSDILDTRFENQDVNINQNNVNVGDDINLFEMDPALKKIMIGVGWDSNAFDSDPVDIDISLFLLNMDGQTRVNEDFVFYNNPETMEGAIRHEGDNRTGAGDGDDETILIDLHGVTFDIHRILFVYSIYRGEEKDQGLGKIRNAYIRIVNTENDHELLRFELDDHFLNKEETGAIVGSLNREGPKWHFTPLMQLEQKGLAKIATDHGMNIIQQ